MPTISICPVCLSRFEQQREWQKFCSRKCRKKSHDLEAKRLIRLAREAGLDKEEAA